MLNRTTLIILGVVLIAGIFIGKLLFDKPTRVVPVFEELVGKKELILAKNNVHQIYVACPKGPILKPAILISWNAALEYALDLKTTPLQMAWRGDSLEIKAPAIQLRKPVIDTKDDLRAIVIKGKIFVNEKHHILNEFAKATDFAAAYGIKRLKDGAVENLVRSELESFLKDIALGMNRPISHLRIEFAPAEPEEPKLPIVDCCNDDILREWCPEKLTAAPLTLLPPKAQKEWKEGSIILPQDLESQ